MPEWDSSGSNEDLEVEDKKANQMDPLAECMVSFFVLSRTNQMTLVHFDVLLGFEKPKSVQNEEYRMA